MDGTELVERVLDGLSSEHGSPVGIVLQGELPFEDWKERCASLSKVRSFGPFALGDVFLYGVAHYGEKRAFAQEPIRLADYTVAFVRKCADVCRDVPYDRRLSGLSFEHHTAVAKVKSPGCKQHSGAPEVGCEDCAANRLDLISEWLQTALEKKWTASHLKDEIKSARTTTVREHQRNLDGAEFDTEGFKEAVGLVKHGMMALRDNISGLITGKGKLDRGKAKTMLTKLETLQESLSQLADRTNAELK